MSRVPLHPFFQCWVFRRRKGGYGPPFNQGCLLRTCLITHDNVRGRRKAPGYGDKKGKKDLDTKDAGCGDEATLGETVSLASVRDAINETMAKAMSELKNNISDQLSDFQSSVRVDIKKRLCEMRTDVNRKMEETASGIEATSRRLEEAERRIGELDTFGVEVDAVSTQVQEIQLELKSKLTELEGQSRRNNIRIGGIKEGTSMVRFVEHLIKPSLLICSHCIGNRIRPMSNILVQPRWDQNPARIFTFNH